MMVSASPSPRSPEVTEKSKKYDRQLRLWGDHGQSRLEKSHVCLINATATGTEILKSLILPGIGSFTIVDGFKVKQEDIGNNFFLDSESLGRSRATSTTKLLLELNADVDGEAIEEHPENLLKQNSSFFSRFSVVIGCGLTESTLLALSKLLWDSSVPFVYVNCIGFLGLIRVQLNEHTVIESHPDNVMQDLRLDCPFPELAEYMEDVKVESREEAMKTPWLVLLYKGIGEYMKNQVDEMEVDKCHPCHMMSRQKQEFKAFLREYLTKVGLTPHDEEYDEVMKAANTALQRTRISSEVRSILEDPKAQNPPPKSKFWIMCAALREFVDENGQLPLCGVLPDMIAESDRYIKLQNVYHSRFLRDSEDILSRTQTLSKDFAISEDEVKLFTKEAQNLRLIRGYSVYEELNSTPTDILQELIMNTEDADQELMYYLLLRCLLRFETEYKTFPGLLDSDVEPDINRFKGVFGKYDWGVTVGEDCVHEVCRYGGCELAGIAGIIGGCAAQEVIKIITKQYVPLDNTFIYNGMQSTSRSFKMGPNNNK